MTGAAHLPVHRPATPGDAGEIARLEGLCFSPAWSGAMVAASLAAAGTHAWLAVDPAGRALGFALFRRIGAEAELLRLATDPVARRRGVGAGLLGSSLAAIRFLGARECWLEVRADNLPARRLYERFGFRRGERRRGYYADGGDALVYVLSPMVG